MGVDTIESGGAGLKDGNGVLGGLIDVRPKVLHNGNSSEMRKS